MGLAVCSADCVGLLLADAAVGCVYTHTCMCLQEDEPVKTAEHLQHFLHRFRIGAFSTAVPLSMSVHHLLCPLLRKYKLSPSWQHATHKHTASPASILCLLLLDGARAVSPRWPDLLQHYDLQ
jgi:hypothetical protein